MPFHDPILPIALVALLASGISMWAFNTFSSTSSKIRDTHTRFAFSQITDRLHNVEDASFPRTMTELLTTLRTSNIDWNSCEIEGDRILDGWRQPITATFDGSVRTWTFRSPGKDAEIATGDDIVTTTTRNQPANTGRQATASPSPAP